MVEQNRGHCCNYVGPENTWPRKMASYQAVANVAVGLIHIHATPVTQDVGDTAGTVDEPHIILPGIWRWTETTNRRHSYLNMTYVYGTTFCHYEALPIPFTSYFVTCLEKIFLKTIDLLQIYSMLNGPVLRTHKIWQTSILYRFANTETLDRYSNYSIINKKEYTTKYANT